MQWVGENAPVATTNPVPMRTVPQTGADAAAQATRYADFKIIRRNGSVVGFEPGKISIAVTKAFLAVNGGQGAASARVRPWDSDGHSFNSPPTTPKDARSPRSPHNPSPLRRRHQHRRRHPPHRPHPTQTQRLDGGASLHQAHRSPKVAVANPTPATEPPAPAPSAPTVSASASRGR